MKEMIAFTDGKYDYRQKICGYGCAVADKPAMENSGQTKLMIYRRTCPDGYAMKEYAGQMEAVFAAVSYAVRQQYEGVIVYTPCTSFEHWYTGDWEAETRFAKEYLNHLYDLRKQILVQVRSEVPSVYLPYMKRAGILAKEILN